MRTKPNSIEIVPAWIAAAPTCGLDSRVVSVAFAPSVPEETVVSRGKPRLRLASRWTDHRAGEFWESLSYAILWLCGWIGIGLCFL